jgi:hypothetical protein
MRFVYGHIPNAARSPKSISSAANWRAALGFECGVLGVAGIKPIREDSIPSPVKRNALDATEDTAGSGGDQHLQSACLGGAPERIVSIEHLIQREPVRDQP